MTLQQRQALNLICDCSTTVTREVLDMPKIGARLRAMRIKADISVRAMARHLGVSAPFVSDCELGRRNLGLDRIASFIALCSKES